MKYMKNAVSGASGGLLSESRLQNYTFGAPGNVCTHHFLRNGSQIGPNLVPKPTPNSHFLAPCWKKGRKHKKNIEKYNEK